MRARVLGKRQDNCGHSPTRLSGIFRFRIASGTGLARAPQVAKVASYESIQRIFSQRLGNWPSLAVSQFKWLSGGHCVQRGYIASFGNRGLGLSGRQRVLKAAYPDPKSEKGVELRHDFTDE